MKFLFNLFLFFLSSGLFASDFSNIQLKGWTKEILAVDHLRFKNFENKNLIIHLQVESFDKEESWNEKNLAFDIAKMVGVRKIMSSFLGMSQYQISTFKLKKHKIYSTLDISGSYIRLKNQLMHFREINFYHNEHFLQLKVISEASLPNQSEIDKWIKEINPDQVEID